MTGWKPKWLLRRRAAALLARAERDPNVANLKALDRFRAAQPGGAKLINAGERALRQFSPSSSVERTGPLDKGNLPTPARQRFAIAASLAFAAVGGATIYALHTAQNPTVVAVFLMTRVGEIREVPLVDGSKVILDTGSALRIELGKRRRHALLEHGRARFSVSRKEVPFTIETATASVKVEQGVIDVSSGEEDCILDLIEGSAQVTPEAKQRAGPTTLQSPALVSTANGAVRELARQQDSGWPSGRLTFVGARIADVVLAANRYATRKIIIADPEIGNLKVSGVFRAGDPDSLARSLASAFSLAVSRGARDGLILTRHADRKKVGG